MLKAKRSVLCLAILLVGPTMALTQRYSQGGQRTKTTGVPSITSISPTGVTAGGAAFTLTVNGSTFASNAAVLWNGASMTTTYVSDTQLTAAIPNTLIAAAGTAQIAVYNPGRSGGTSNIVAFTINAPTTTTTPTTSTTSTTTSTTTTPLSISTTSLPAGTAGTAYGASLVAAGGTSPYTWTVTSGGLPAGLSLATNGAISGTPTTAVSYAFTAQVADSASHTASQTYSVTINPSSTTSTTITGVLFQTGFETSDPTFDYSTGSPDVTITSTPPPGRSGDALQIHYTLCGDPKIAPSLGQILAGTLPQQVAYVKYTYVNTTGQTGPSAEAAVTVAANNVVTVMSPPPSVRMTAYNVYVSTTSGAEVLQNSTPIAIGTDWSGPLTGLVAGTAAPPSANAAGCGGATQDTNLWVSKILSPGQTHFFTRAYVYFKGLEPDATQGTIVQRKIMWWSDSTTASNSSGTYSPVITSWTGSGGIPTSTINLSLFDQSPGGCFATWEIDDVAALNFNMWYELEVEMQLNTPGASDGIVRLWVNGSQVYSNTALNLRGTCSTPISFFSIGRQVNRYHYDVVDEYRYWDDFAVSGSYLP